LRKVERNFYSQIRAAGKFIPDVNQATDIGIKKVAAGEMRKILSEKDPDLAKLNANYSFFSKLNEVAENTNKRISGKSGGLTANMAGVAGANATPGGIPERVGMAYALKRLVMATRSPGWHLTSARIKNNLANVLAGSEPEKLSSISNSIIEKGKPVVAPEVAAAPDKLQAVTAQLSEQAKQQKLKDAIEQYWRSKQAQQNLPIQLPSSRLEATIKSGEYENK